MRRVPASAGAITLRNLPPAVAVELRRLAGTPVPTNSAWIAASAMEHGLIVLTTDRHYGRLPQVVSEYFDIDADNPPDKTIS